MLGQKSSSRIKPGRRPQKLWRKGIDEELDPMGVQAERTQDTGQKRMQITH